MEVQNATQTLTTVSFSWYDYILFCGMLSMSALIGVYFGCFGSKQSSAAEYLMGNKKMKVFPISVSLVASHVSGITLLAIPADVYKYGASYWLSVIALAVVGVMTIYIYLPVFYKLQFTSTYEYLERRFDNRTRMFASFLFALGLFLYLPIVIYIPALALSAATGINVHFITPVVCGVCIFYTTLGGLKAVVWTDTLQFVVTMGTVITVFFLGIRSAGGIGVVWAKAMEGHRLYVLDFDPDPTKRDSFWITTLGMGSGWLGMCAIHQSCVQKFLSLSSFRESKRSVIYFCFGCALMASFSVFTGLIMYAKYADCDPFTTGVVKKSDQMLPYYIMDVAAHIPGLPGLFIAGIFSAALSTLSASLNCLAGTIYEDFILKFTHQTHNEKSSSYILKVIVVVTGVVCTLLVYVFEMFGSIVPIAISLGGVTTGPSLAMFTLGILFPKVSSKGVFYGSLIGLLFTSYVVVMAQYYQLQGAFGYPAKPVSTDGCLANISTVLNVTTNTLGDSSEPFFLFRVSFFYYTILGVAVSMAFALLISYFMKNDDPPVSRDLLSPVIYGLLSDDNAQGQKTEYCEIKNALKLIINDDEKENTLHS